MKDCKWMLFAIFLLIIGAIIRVEVYFANGIGGLGDAVSGMVIMGSIILFMASFVRYSAKDR